MHRCLVSLALTCMIACNSKAHSEDFSSPGARAVEAAATPAAEAAVMPAAPSCLSTQLRACFGELMLLAGRGEIGRKGEDGWRSAFEGKPAIEVELSRPHFAMADDAGNIYIADKDADAVRRVAPDGRITTLAGDYSSPNGLWVRPDGTVYVLDLGHDRIVRVASSGAVVSLFEIPEGLAIGRGLWVADDEELAYVASGTKLLRWTPERGVHTLSEGFGSLANLAVDPKGRLVVTDRARGRVLRIDEEGGATLIAGNGAQADGGDGVAALHSSLPGVRAICFDSRGGYFLGTHESDRVWYVDAGGVLHAFLSAPVVSEVRGLSLDRDENLLVVDDDRGFVRVLPRLD